MTNLEISYTVVFWILYGVYNGYRWANSDNPWDGVGEYVWSIVFAPIALVVRAIRGILWI